MMTKTLIVAVALIATSTEAGVAQDVAKGEISFKKCVICHSIGPGAQNKVGPAQNGLDGRKAGSVPNYQYSDANKNSGIVWKEATFKEYIKDPKAKIPCTKMAFAGIKKRSGDQRPLGLNNSMPTAISKSNPNELNVALPPGTPPKDRNQNRIGVNSV
jgi:cytochrome c